MKNFSRLLNPNIHPFDKKQIKIRRCFACPISEPLHPFPDFHQPWLARTELFPQVTPTSTPKPKAGVEEELELVELGWFCEWLAEEGYGSKLGLLIGFWTKADEEDLMVKGDWN